MILRTVPRSAIVAAAGAVLSIVTALAASPASDSAKKALAIAHGSNCFSCHAINRKVVGPAFTAVARKYAGQGSAEGTLAEAIKKGHVGTWGNVPMPPHPELSDAQVKELAAWVLSLKSQKAWAASAAGKSYTYTVNGKQVTTHFPIFKPGTKNVTADVFRGYELYNSYCFRCHGVDVTPSEYAPDLRLSLNNGMTKERFLTIAMEGNKAKGMPSWAGFFTPHQIDVIYQYVKARALGVLDVGTPKE